MSANDATATTGNVFDLGDLSASALGTGVASPLGAPMPLPSYATNSPASPTTRAPANDNRMIWIAAISGGVALLLLLLLLAGGLVAWMVFSGGSEVAENPPANHDTGSALVDQATSRAPPAPGSPSPASPSPTSTPAQHNPTTPSGLYAGARGDDTSPVASDADGASGSPSTTGPVAPTSGPSASQQAKLRDDNGLRMKFCFCPPGRFTYGEDPEDAEITNEFWIGQTEVTQGQWTQVMQTTPWAEQKNPVSGDDYPANYVSWRDAMAFCSQMTQVERQQGRLDGDLEYRLPTLAEWHYVSLAPRTSPSTGEPLKLEEFAWLEKNSGRRMHAVGELPANSWGVHDLLGNLQEWTLDRFATADQAQQPAQGGPNPFQWHDVAEGARQQFHMAKGGDYSSRPSGLRGLAMASTSAPRNFGFRVVLAPPAKPQAPGPSPEKLWFVLSNLRVSPPSLDAIEFSVDWKLAQGRPQPGRKYLIYVNMKVVNGFVSRMEAVEIDLSAQQGTAEGTLPAKDANGLLGIQYAVVGDEEGTGFSALASGELRIGKGPTAAQPPAR